MRHGCVVATVGTLVVLLGAWWGAAGAQAQGDGDPQAGLVVPFEQFAQSRGVDPAALAQELRLPAEADLKAPLGRLMREHGFGRPEVQQALQKIKTGTTAPQQPKAAEAQTPVAPPAAVTPPDPLAEEAAGKDWRKIRIKFALWVTVFIAASQCSSRPWCCCRAPRSPFTCGPP